MGIGAGAKCNLCDDESRKPSHGQEQRIPSDDDFAIPRLFDEPHQKEQQGASFEDEGRPMIDGSKGKRTKHEQPEGPVKQESIQGGVGHSPQPGLHLAKASHPSGAGVGSFHFVSGAAIGFSHGCLGGFPDDTKIIDPELTTDRTARRKPPNVQYHQFAVGSGGEMALDRLPFFFGS